MNEALILAQIRLRPDREGVPGIEQGEQIAQGLIFWALVGLGVAVVLGALIWAFSSRANNPHYSAQGRSMALIALAAAIIVGAAAALVNWAHRLGRQVQGGGGGNGDAAPGLDPGADGLHVAAELADSLIQRL